MSGNSYEYDCPNCKNKIKMYSDHKPFDMINGTCFDCGFVIETETRYLNLEELNYERKEYCTLPPLTCLPKQEKIG